MHARRIVAAGTGLVLVTGLMVALQQGTAGAKGPAGVPRPPAPHLTTTHPVPVAKPPADAVKAAASRTVKPTVSWPEGGVGTVPALSGAPAKAASLPVRVATPAPSRTAAGAQTPPAAVRIQVLDHASAVKRGVDGMLLKVRRSDGKSAAGPVSVSVDYSGFRHAYGGELGSRLQPVALPSSGA